MQTISTIYIDYKMKYYFQCMVLNEIYNEDYYHLYLCLYLAGNLHLRPPAGIYWTLF